MLKRIKYTLTFEFKAPNLLSPNEKAINIMNVTKLVYCTSKILYGLEGRKCEYQDLSTF